MPCAYAFRSCSCVLKQNSGYETMQILGISTFDKTSIRELLTNIQINQNVIEQLNLFTDIC
jgi:hypothetical protein